MARYFIEVAYKGTNYSGFQVQENAVTVQSEVEKALQILHQSAIRLTGSSRTDAGVHALQNYFHFDYDAELHHQAIYKLNAILPGDIVVKNIFLIQEESHSRFDALSREYSYKIHTFKDPFLRETSLYYPYKLNLPLLAEATSFLTTQQNFFAFCKTNTQVKNYNCTILKSEWVCVGDNMVYNIEANRFLRGMVRLVTATLLKVGREKLSLFEFKELFLKMRKCGYSVPAHGLYLNRVKFPENYFPATVEGFKAFG